MMATDDWLTVGAALDAGIIVSKAINMDSNNFINLTFNAILIY
jgi:hypothetical protein